VWKEKKETLERKKKGVYSKLLFSYCKLLVIEIKQCILSLLSVSNPPPVVSPTNIFHHCIVYNPKDINTKGWLVYQSFITIIQKTISLILTWYQSKTIIKQPSIIQQSSFPAAFFQTSPLHLVLFFQQISRTSSANSAKLLSPMDNQELHYSAASAPQSSFSIMAPTATYGVSPTAAIISHPNMQ
jgi:hypothetical protein